MNVFTLEIDVDGRTTFRVDGRDLMDLIAEAERPLVTSEGAGSYFTPRAEAVLKPSRHLLGIPGDDEWGEESERGKVAIGGCDGCGVVGCWPLLVRIEVLDDRVVWSDFENPFRGQESVDPADPDDNARDWSSVGPFTVNRKRYEFQLRERRAAGSTGRSRYIP